jgi:hypothetical protein
METVQNSGLATLELLAEKRLLNKNDIDTVLSVCRNATDTNDPPLTEVVKVITQMHAAVISPFAEHIAAALSEEEQAAILGTFLEADRIAANAAGYGLRRIVHTAF